VAALVVGAGANGRVVQERQKAVWATGRGAAGSSQKQVEWKVRRWLLMSRWIHEGGSRTGSSWAGRVLVARVFAASSGGLFAGVVVEGEERRYWRAQRVGRD
jgi:hypothetical protein